MAATSTQRARLLARMASAQARRQIRDADADTDLTAGELAGSVDGVAFDWQETFFLDTESNALYDYGDQFARDMRQALTADWKLRQLSEILTSSIKGATWSLQPGTTLPGVTWSGPSPESIAQDCEEKLRRPANHGGMSTPIGMVIAQATSAIVYRRAYFAKGWKLDTVRRDGSAMYSQLAMRPASTCRLLRDQVDGSFLGFEQDIVWIGAGARKGWDGKPVQFPPRKALVFVNGMDRDPVSGESDLEVALWCWRTKRKVMLLWTSFLQAQALPRTMVGHKGDEERAKAAARTIAGMGSSGVGYYDQGQLNLDVLDVSGKGPQSFIDMVKYLDSCASGSVVAGWTDLTSAAASGRGSYALSTDSRDAFDETREHAAASLGEALSMYAIADMAKYNYGPGAPAPTWKFDKLTGTDEQQLLSLLQALATSQSSVLPQEFINELAIKAAHVFDLDVDKVQSALEVAAKRAEQAAKDAGANVVGQTAAAVHGAVQGVQAVARHVAGVTPPTPATKPTAPTRPTPATPATPPTRATRPTPVGA